MTNGKLNSMNSHNNSSQKHQIINQNTNANKMISNNGSQQFMQNHNNLRS